MIDPNGTTMRVPIGGRIIVHDIISLYTAMTAGLGIGLLPELALHRAQEDGTLTQVLPGHRVETNPLYAIIPTSQRTPPRIEVFIDWLAEFISTLDTPTTT
jgi:DNA-binding transcriptional LysR family regulator